MAEKKDIVVKAQARDGRGKNDSRRARRNGQVPVVIYGGQGESVAALAPLSELAAILRSDTGRNTIFTVDVEGVGASEVMFADRQIDPVRMRLIHADFKRLVKGEKIEATVPLRLVGEPIGVREQSGMLEQIVREHRHSLRTARDSRTHRCRRDEPRRARRAARFRHSGGCRDRDSRESGHSHCHCRHREGRSR